ncbi:MAG TPA: hypothetical protein ENK37_01995 [Oceanithermus profundus]|uniref:Bacterial Ig domain-containing protein n=1 Tax=Oceanithermus profundus TaxID=187137 RepID=A0A7C4Z4F7_9DEIN|nr:hypothetical protein [Oceanithermus profundus]
MTRRFPLPYDYFKALVALVLLLWLFLRLGAAAPKPPTLSVAVDPSGSVTFSGEAPPGREVRVRITPLDTPANPAEVASYADDRGQWLAGLALEPGPYRAQAVAAEVASDEVRFEVPAPAALSPLTLTAPEPTTTPLRLSGTAEPGAWVVVYADGRPVGRVRANDDGAWSLAVDLGSGAHNLIVAYEEAPDVTSDPVAAEVLAPPAPEPQTAVAEEQGAANEPVGRAYVVQEDDWLSKLAAEFLGDARRYHEIREATNAAAARDASFAIIEEDDLIYPGEKIWIPAP